YAVQTLVLLLLLYHDSATTAIYTLSLHDALPILHKRLLRGIFDQASAWLLIKIKKEESSWLWCNDCRSTRFISVKPLIPINATRSEEHTSELQSRENLVCRLLLEKKKNTRNTAYI